MNADDYGPWGAPKPPSLSQLASNARNAKAQVRAAQDNLNRAHANVDLHIAALRSRLSDNVAAILAKAGLFDGEHDPDGMADLVREFAADAQMLGT